MCYHGFCMIPHELRVGFYPYPAQVRCLRVRLWCDKSRPSVYPWQTLGVPIWWDRWCVYAVIYTPPRIPSQSVRTPHGLCGVHVDSARTMRSPRSPHDFECPCGLCSKIVLGKDWTGVSTAEPIAAVRSALDHYTIVALYALLTYAICVTCGLIRKHIYFYSIWDIWYMSWTRFLMGIQWQCPFCDRTNHIW